MANIPVICSKTEECKIDCPEKKPHSFNSLHCDRCPQNLFRLVVCLPSQVVGVKR